MASFRIVDGPNLFGLEHGLFDPKPTLVELTIEYDCEGLPQSAKLSVQITSADHPFGNDLWGFKAYVMYRQLKTTKMTKTIDHWTNPGATIEVIRYDPQKRNGEVNLLELQG